MPARVEKEIVFSRWFVGFSGIWHTGPMLEVSKNDWKCLNVAVKDKGSGVVIEYKIHFYRKTNGRYDEVWYDSHEIKRGRKVASPHLHLKLATPFKDSSQGEQELRRIIETMLPQIQEITR